MCAASAGRHKELPAGMAAALGWLTLRGVPYRAPDYSRPAAPSRPASSGVLRGRLSIIYKACQKSAIGSCWERRVFNWRCFGLRAEGGPFAPCPLAGRRLLPVEPQSEEAVAGFWPAYLGSGWRGMAAAQRREPPPPQVISRHRAAHKKSPWRRQRSAGAAPAPASVGGRGDPASSAAHDRPGVLEILGRLEASSLCLWSFAV